MNVKEIIKKYLVDNKYDGLYNDIGCGCEVSDLMPCNGEVEKCSPGYRHPCSCGDDCSFHIVPF